MAYINGKKVIQVVKTKTLPQLYKHSVYLIGRNQNNKLVELYADLYTTDSNEYTDLHWDDVMAAWEGVISGLIENDSDLAYMKVDANSQAELYVNVSDIHTSPYSTLDMSVMQFDGDDVTPYNI